LSDPNKHRWDKFMCKDRLQTHDKENGLNHKKFKKNKKEMKKGVEGNGVAVQVGLLGITT
jgi:hypothetical protein